MDDEVAQFHEWVVQEPLGNVDRSEGRWESLNKRRLELIEKEAGVGLSEDEQSELETIQKETGRRLNIIAPSPFELLERLEEQVRRAGIPLDQEEASGP